MLALALVSLLTAEPRPVGVALAQNIGVPLTREQLALEALGEELTHAGQPVQRLTTACAARLECLADAAAKAQLPAVIAVTLGAAGRDVLVDLEAVTSDGRTSLGQATFKLGTKVDAATRTRIASFAFAVQRGLPPLPPPPEPVKPPPEPVVLVPTPTPVPTPAPWVPVAEESEEKGSIAPGLLLGGGAAVALGVGAGFGYLANADRTRLFASPDGVHSNLTLREANALRSSANAQLTGALVAGVAAGALTTALIVWLAAR